VATNVCCAPAATFTAAGVTTTGNPELVIVIVALAIFVVSACATAETETAFGVGTTAGAVYKPLESIVPTLVFPPAAPFTCQFTPVVLVPLTVAVNCCVCLVCSVAEAGESVTVIPVEEEVDDELFFPPHADKLTAISKALSTAMAWRERRTRPCGPLFLCVARISKNALQQCRSRKKDPFRRATHTGANRRDAIRMLRSRRA
jgi:hypothetical protein